MNTTLGRLVVLRTVAGVGEETFSGRSNIMLLAIRAV